MPAISPSLLANIKVSVPAIATSLTTALPISPEIKNIDKTAGHVLGKTPEVLLNVTVATALIVGAWLLCGWLASYLNRLLVKARVEETLAAFLASTARFVVFFSTFLLALSFLGMGSASTAAFIAAVGLAVGFALRGTLGNVAGGIMLMVHRPVKVGDYVENSNVSGTVKRIGMFSTEVNTKEFIRVFIPNALMWENVLRNHTYNRIRLHTAEFTLAHGTDVRAAFETLKQALSLNPLALNTPEPVFAIDHFEEGGIACKVEVWTRTEDRSKLKNTLLLDIMETLRQNAIPMAWQPAAETTAAATGKE